MFVQILGFLALAPSTIINDHTSNWEAFRAAVASLPWIVQFVVVLVASDMAQYWFHRSFHRYPFLWGFHAVHHSAKSMDRSEEHTSELQSLMRISYAVFCLKKKKTRKTITNSQQP